MKKLLVLVCAVFAFQLSVQAQQPLVFSKNSKAIDGYDAVAFFTKNNAVAGKEEFTTKWQDANWLFSSKQNLDSFIVNPNKYAPQYGGYCAYGCSNGYKAPTQIETWSIFNNKLYFNYNLKVKEMWMKNNATLIEKADENWEKIKAK